MASSKYVEYQDNGFWVSDVISDLYLKHLIDVAVTKVNGEPWLAREIKQWRVNMIVSDYGIRFGRGWTESEFKVFLELAEATNQILQHRGDISAEEVASWETPENKPIFLRGMKKVQIKSLVEFGQAIISLLSGTMKEPPEGTFWFYGPDGVTTIGRSS